MPEIYDFVIIGGGCAGLAAGMYAGRLNLKTLLLTEDLGGTITMTDNVENYPGFIRLTGLELAEKLEAHARDYPITIKQEKVQNIQKEGSFFAVTTKNGTSHAKTILFATGAAWRKLAMKGAKELENKGVHYCALCDGALYKDKITSVVGGADSAAKEVLVLAQHARKVYMIARGDKIRPEPVNGRRIDEQVRKGKVVVLLNTNVMEIKGDKKVASMILDKPYEGKTELPMDAVFGAIGHTPNSSLAAAIGVKLNDKKEILINRKSETNIPGIYAAGDVADTEFKQAITGVGEAVTASYHAFKYVNENEFIAPVDDPHIKQNSKIGADKVVKKEAKRR